MGVYGKRKPGGLEEGSMFSYLSKPELKIRHREGSEPGKQGSFELQRVRERLHQKRVRVFFGVDLRRPVTVIPVSGRCSGARRAEMKRSNFSSISGKVFAFIRTKLAPKAISNKPKIHKPSKIWMFMKWPNLKSERQISHNRKIISFEGSRTVSRK